MMKNRIFQKISDVENCIKIFNAILDIFGYSDWIWINNRWIFMGNSFLYFHFSPNQLLDCAWLNLCVSHCRNIVRSLIKVSKSIISEYILLARLWYILNYHKKNHHQKKLFFFRLYIERTTCYNICKKKILWNKKEIHSFLYILFVTSKKRKK